MDNLPIWAKTIIELCKFPLGALVVIITLPRIFSFVENILVKRNEIIPSNGFVKQVNCNETHRNIENNIENKFQRLYDKFDEFKDKIIEETTENRTRLEGIGIRLENHYTENDKKYLNILDVSSNLLKKMEELKKQEEDL